MRQDIAERGPTDPYGYNTLAHSLLNILRIWNRADVQELLRHVVNEGLKYHREDPIFGKAVQRYFREQPDARLGGRSAD
jgi:hypothetical protein